MLVVCESSGSQVSRATEFDAIPAIERLASDDGTGRRRAAALALRNLERRDNRTIPLQRKFAWRS